MEYQILEKLNEIKLAITKNDNDRWLTIAEVIQYTSVSDSTIRRAVKRGVLKASQSIGKLLFKKSNVDRWLNG